MRYCSISCVAALYLSVLNVQITAAVEPGLVAHWKLAGDSQDHSGQSRHATSDSALVSRGEFNGKHGCFAEVDSSPALQFGTNDFTIAAWVNTEREVHDAPGDILSKVDPVTGRGLHLSLQSSSPGYNSQSNVRQVFFGLGGSGNVKWTDCGRPGGKAHSSDALTVFNGDLYAGTTDGPTGDDWAHVYRYCGNQTWDDCGRLGTGRTRGVYAMIVHDGSLYAATSSSHGPQPPSLSFGRVYRYLGGQSWEDIGQPGENFRLNALASFRGKLYVVGFNIGPRIGYCYEYEGGQKWKQCGEFAGWPHTLLVHDDRLHAAYPNGEVYAYDGRTWENLGNPYSSTKICSQIHALGVYRGELYAGAWPSGKIAFHRSGEWIDLGHAGDSTEIVGLTVYNGSLYAGTIPRAEVFRFDGPERWISQRRLFDPPGYMPVPVGEGGEGVADWSRASSLAVFQGKLFNSTATCYRTNIEKPLDDEPRGKVFAFESGAAVSYDQDLAPGWKHVTAVRRDRDLELLIDGQSVAKAYFDEPVDVSNDAPLQIGFGPQSHFRGSLRDVKLYNLALGPDEIKRLAQTPRSE